MFSWLKKALPGSENTRHTNSSSGSRGGSLAKTDLPNEYDALKRRGNEFLSQGMLERAAQCYREAVSINPTHAEGFLNLGFVSRELKLYQDAERYLQQAVRIDPAMADAYYLLGGIAQECGNLAGAVDNYRKTLELKPDFEIAYLDLFHLFFQSGQYAGAKSIIQQGLAVNPGSAEFQYCLGKLHVQEKELEQAIVCYQKVLSIQPDFAEAHGVLGNIFKDQGRLDEAEACYHKALELDPDDADEHNNLGAVFLDRGDLEKAQACYRKAIELQPDFFEAHNNLGFVLAAQGDLSGAIDCYQRALALKPDSAEVNNNLGDAFRNQGRLNEAVSCYHRAIALKRDFSEAYNNLGAVLIDLGSREEAMSCYRQALAFHPDFFLAHNNLGILLQEQGKLDQALPCYRKALELAPDFPEAKINLLYALQSVCEWQELGPLTEALRRVVREAPPATANRISPFSFLALPGTTPSEQRICASNWAQRICQRQSSRQKGAEFEFKRETKQKINVGYLSADFRNHPVAHLMAQIFELHDRSRFSITAYSYGPDDGSMLRKRLEKSFDQFVDIRALPDEASAQRIHQDRIDILVDLAGYTKLNRSPILALRPAPIQVNYLGYPGTMGAGFVDYLIADRFIIPPEQQAHYAEKVVSLPYCYMPRDASCQRLPAPSRKQCGLPDEGFVFCSFNQPYKITPDVFDIWCRLLKAVPNSVLWLPSSASNVVANLCRETASRGVAPERIIWAPRLNLAEEHLARIQCADLFLDTTPYNAHTTCSDALWMGLPVVTCAGETFPSRVAGSLLTALGIPELITYSLEDYYALALALATDRNKYRDIRNKILANRESAPLFNSKNFTRDLEAVYLQMWDEYANSAHADCCL
jgi:predicted O-linked N-acetylglucosamine transferase (SPINDLY family)